MYTEELDEGEVELKSGEEKFRAGFDDNCPSVAVLDAKRVLVGLGARALFYPTLLYNILRNKIQSEFRWWDRIDEFILLGAVPFPTDVARLKELGVSGVVTLNEPYETLVPTSLYHAYNIVHLVIPTRDYMYAPSLADICQAVDFIHENASLGKTTYIHCKAGRGRSTTVLLCYLVRHRHMTPSAAYEHVKAIRPRVLLAASQWQAVQDYYLLEVKKIGSSSSMTARKPLNFLTAKNTDRELAAFDDGSFVLITDTDLDGYDIRYKSYGEDNKSSGGHSLFCRVQFPRRAAISRLSGLWSRCPGNGKTPREKRGSSIRDDRVNLTVDIQVY